MKAKNIPKTIVLLLMLVFIAGIVNAAECTGTFSGPTDFVYVGVPFTLNYFNAEPASAGDTLTLTLPPADVDNNSALVHSPIAPFTPYTWDVVVNLEGDYSFVADIAGVGCNKTFNVTVVDNVSDPSLSISMEDVGDVLVDQSFSYDVNLTNAGPGDAANVDGLTYTNSGSGVAPGSFAVASIGTDPSNDTHTASYTITPSVCGLDVFNVLVQNYEDVGGEDMGSLSGDDQFNVVGSDVGFLSFTATSYSVVQGDSVTFNANVRNVGTSNVTSGEVELEFDGDDINQFDVSGLGISENTALVHNYAVASDATPGNYTVRAWIDADNECDGSNNEETFNLEVTQGTCGDGIVNNGEACDGGSDCDSSCNVINRRSSGGGTSTSQSVDITLTESLPSASTSVGRYDVVRLSYNGKTYSFRFRSIFSDLVRVELISPSKDSSLAEGAFETYDLDRDGEDDLKLTIIAINNRQADVKFELLGVAGHEPVPILDFPEPKSRDRTVISAPVGSPSGVEPEQESLLKGFITFVENFAVKKTVPVWAGALLALLIAGSVAGLFFVLTRKN